MYTESDITEFMLDMGIPSSILGSGYIRSALMLLRDDADAIYRITTRVYPEVARMHGTRVGRAERAIRHAIEVGWKRGDPGLQRKVFGHSIDPGKGRPTNSEFLARAAGYLRSRTDSARTFADAPLPFRKEFLRLWDLFLAQKEEDTPPSGGVAGAEGPEAGPA